MKNYPNSFSTKTNIYYETKNAGMVRVEIANMFGQKIKMLKNEGVPVGNYIATWDGTDAAGQQLSNGVYFYTVYFENVKRTGKVILSK